MTPINIARIGPGRMGRIYARLINESPLVKLMVGEAPLAMRITNMHSVGCPPWDRSHERLRLGVSVHCS